MPDLAKYGLTGGDWHMILEVQGNRCPLCLKKFSLKRRPVVDHNHRTGHVRGALCGPCNYRLGFLHDDAGWLGRASNYLLSPVADDVFTHPRRHVDAPPEAPNAR